MTNFDNILLLMVLTDLYNINNKLFIDTLIYFINDKINKEDIQKIKGEIKCINENISG